MERNRSPEYLDAKIAIGEMIEKERLSQQLMSDLQASPSLDEASKAATIAANCQIALTRKKIEKVSDFNERERLVQLLKKIRSR